MIEEDLDKTEERLNVATTKLNEASQAADESERLTQAAFSLLGFYTNAPSLLKFRVIRSFTHKYSISSIKLDYLRVENPKKG